MLEDLKRRFGVGGICVVADPGLVSEATVAAVFAHGFDHLLATRLHNCPELAAVLEAATLRHARWQPAPEASSVVCDVTHEGQR